VVGRAAIADTGGGHAASGGANTGGPATLFNGKPCEEDCDCGDGGSGEGTAAPAQEPSAPKSGDPVDVYSGRNFNRHVDLVIPGVFPIRMVRYYDSKSSYDSPLGYGWALNLHMGAYKEKGSHFTVRSRCGNRLRYLAPTSGNVFTPADPELGRVPDLEETTIPELVGTGLEAGTQWVQPNGKRVVFDALGRVYATFDAHGNKHQYQYADEGVTGPGSGGPGEDDRFPLIGASPFGVRPEKLITTSYYYKLIEVREYVLVSGVHVDSGRFAELEYDDGEMGESNTGRLIEIRGFPSEDPQNPRSVRYFHDEPPAPVAPGLCASDDADFLLSSTQYRGNTTRYAGNLTRVEHSYTRVEQADPPVPGGETAHDEAIVESFAYFDRIREVYIPPSTQTDPNDPNHPDNPSTDVECRLRDYHNLTSYVPSEGADPWFYEYDDSDRVVRETHGADLTDVTRAEWMFSYRDEAASPQITDWTVSRRIEAGGVVDVADRVYEFSEAGLLESEEVWSGARDTSSLLWRRVYIRNATTTFLERILTCEGTPGVSAEPECTTNGPPGASGAAYPLARDVRLTYSSAGNLRSRTVDLGHDSLQLQELWGGSAADSNWVGSYEIRQGENLEAAGSEIVKSTFQTTTPVDAGGLSGRGRRFTSQTIAMPDPGVPDAVTTFLYDDVGGQLGASVLPSATFGGADHLAICRIYNAVSSAAPESAGRVSQVSLSYDTPPISTSCQTMADELKRSFQYGPAGFVSQIQDAKGNTTSFDYDELGRVRAVTNALGQITRFRYSGPNEGLVESAWPAGHYLSEVELGATTLSDGVRRRFIYNTRGRLVAIQNEDSPGVFATLNTFEYDSDGNRILSTDAGRGAVNSDTRLEFVYDSVGRLIEARDAAPAASNVSTFEYDAFGNRVKSIQATATPNQRQTDFEFDGFDRLRSVSEPGPNGLITTMFGYDAASNVVAVTEPTTTVSVNQTTEYLYDGASRLTEVRPPEHNADDDPLPPTVVDRSVSYKYDGRGRRTRNINARKNVLEFTYASWGGLEKIEYFADETAANASTPISDRMASFSYDDNGNLRSAADTRATSEFGTAPTGRLPSGGNSELLANRLYTFSYDALNRVDSVIAHYAADSNGVTLASVFDTRGNRTSLAITDPGSTSEAQAWCYDGRDRLDGLFSLNAAVSCPGTPTVDYEYYANSDLKQIVHGNGLETDFTYDRHGPVSAITLSDPNASELYSLVYGDVDAFLNVTTITETVSGGAEMPDYAYQYDEALRLKNAAYPTGLGLMDQSFDYDDRGNREDSSVATAYEYDDDNRMTSSPGRTYQFDDDGNMTLVSDGTNAATLVWDNSNRLTQYVDGLSPSTPTTNYFYDPFGRRIRKRVDAGPNQGTTDFVWDGDRLLAEYQGTVRNKRYEYGLGYAPIRVDLGSGVMWDVHVDHLDTPKVLTNSSRAIAWRASYEAFGKSNVIVGAASEMNIRFPGQYFDAETGLHYNRFRYYDPGVGRYISADPIGQDGGANLYTYAANNPVNSVDPTGEITVRDVANFSAGFGDSLLLGIPGALRDDDGFVDPCSDAYDYGAFASLAAGVARLGYAAAAKAASKLASSGAAASAARASAKNALGLGATKNVRKPNLAKYKTDDELRAAAGRTNPGANAYGAGVAGAAGYNATRCECRE
jgi:RHS repeat-associated protein